MARKKENKALPVGLFILIGMVVLVAGILWLRNITMQPAYEFIVAWRDPDPVAEGVAVYYRGVQVGRVARVTLAEDFESTLVVVGVTRERLRIPEDSEVFIRLEGITGQRYLEIEPPPPDEPVLGYIQPGEIVWGERNVTLDKLQEQLARLAEERTLEKILNRTETALAEFDEAAQSIQQLAQQGERFLDNVQGPSQQAIRQVGATAEEIAAAVNRLEGQTAGLDETLVAVRTAGDQIGGAVGAVQAQLVETDLIPQWALAAEEVTTGIQGFRGLGETLQGQLAETELIPRWAQLATEVQGGVETLRGTAEEVETGVEAFRTTAGEVQAGVRDVRGTAQAVRGGVQEVRGQVRGVLGEAPSRPPEIAELDRVVVSLQEAGQTLERNVARLRAQAPQGQLNGELQALERLARNIQVAAQGGRIGQALPTPEKLRQQLVLLESIGNEILATTERMRPTLQARIAQGVYPQPEEPRNLLATVEALDVIGETLSERAAELEPDVEGLVVAYQRSPQRPGGLIGQIAEAVNQIERTAARFGCVASNINDLLNERFLGFKLFFGKPVDDPCTLVPSRRMELN